MKDEDSSNNGISHLIEHLMFKTESSGSSSSITENIEELKNIGARYNGCTTKDNTCFYIDGLSRDIKTLIKGLSMIVINKECVDKRLLEKEKDIVLREAEAYLVSSRRIGEKVGQALWGDMSYGQLVIGKPEIISEIDEDTINKLIYESYIPENATIVVVGGFDYDEVLEEINRRFGNWKDRFKINREYIIQSNPGIIIDEKFKGGRTTLGIGFQGFNNLDYRSRYTDLLKDVLTKPGSRLFQEIRENRGLVYSLNGFSSSFSITGNVGISFSANNLDIKEIIKICMNEFRNLIEFGVSDSLLQNIKRIKETELLYNIESTNNQLISIGKNAMKGNIFLLEDELRELNKINKIGMDAVIKEIFNNNNMGISILGSPSIDEIIGVLEI